MIIFLFPLFTPGIILPNTPPPPIHHPKVEIKQRLEMKRKTLPPRAKSNGVRALSLSLSHPIKSEIHHIE